MPDHLIYIASQGIGLRFFLAEHIGPEAGAIAAAGWGGDKYVVLYNSEEEIYAVVFVTTWDDQSESDQFWGLFRSAIYHRKGYKEVIESLIGDPEHRCWQGVLDVACAFQDHKDVIIMISSDQLIINNLLELFKAE